MNLIKIKSIQFSSARVKSNQIEIKIKSKNRKSDQIKSNQIKSNQGDPGRPQCRIASLVFPSDTSDSVYQYTTLHIAALSACVRCLRACISEGYDVNALSISGQTPLFLASYVSNSPEERRAEVRISPHSPPFCTAGPT